MKHIITALALVASTTASAEFYDGNELFKHMKGDANNRVLAIGYVAGVFDLGQGEFHCAPQRVSLGQAYDIVEKSMDDRPSIRHMDASILVSAALMEVWPCPKKKGGNL